MGPQKILFTTDDEFIKQKAEQLNKSSTNNFRTTRCRGLISMLTNSQHMYWAPMAPRTCHQMFGMKQKIKTYCIFRDPFFCLKNI